MNIETLTLINGNKQPFETELPLLYIVGEKWNDVAIDHIKENTGLEFKEYQSGMAAQPTTALQMAALFMTYNFKTRYFNNWVHKNTLMLKSDHHVGFNVDSICYNCCKENHIHTTGLKPHERLAC